MGISSTFPRASWRCWSTDGDRSARELWDSIAPYVRRSRDTGYLRAVDLTTERLFGARLSEDTVAEIDGACRALCRPGYYREVLRDVANVERCQVHSMEGDPFCETEQPDLLQQDLSLYPMVTGLDARIERASGIDVRTLDDYVELVEWCFETYASRAVATKLLWAYYRPLAVLTFDHPPRAAFARLRAGAADVSDKRAGEDFLFARCVELAAAAGLPIKIHTGTLAGVPRATFVLMHMGWPQQEQLLAVAKHSPNVVVDLCWAWILSPLATSEFVQRFLTTVPASKLLCFGGDYQIVESVVGHAEIARRGLQHALEALTERGWVSPDRALELVPLLMRGNALRIFPVEDRLAKLG